MATLAQLDALIDANLSAFRAIAATYEFAEGGVPTIDGFVALINNANATNFGSNRTDITFNQENAFINLINAHVQGSTAAAAKFQAVTAGAATLQDKLGMIYDAYVPAANQSAEGRAFFTRPEAVDFYTAVAAERGVAGSDGAAIVALASLFNILVNQDIGLGDDINDLRAAIADGSAQLPESGNTFTPIETADGTTYDIDDAGGNVGSEVTLTTAIGENIVGTTGDDTFNAIIGTGATLNTFDQVRGDAGTDTANIVADAVVTAAQLAQFSEVENVVVNQSVAGGQTAIDVSDSDLTSITFTGTTGLKAGDAVTVAQGQTVNAALSAAGALVVTGEADVTELTANGIGSNVTAFTFNETNTSVKTVNAGGSTAANVTVNGTASTETVNISFEDDVTLAVVGANVETLNMSGSTGDITTTLLANITSVTGGSGDDTITDVTGATTVAVNLGAGSDTFNIAAGDATDGVTITLGAGGDTLNINALANIQGGTAADLVDDIYTVTDFDPTQDLLDVSGVGAGLSTAPLQTAITAETSLEDALDVAAADADDTLVFEYSGNLYVYIDEGDGLFGAGDGLVEIVGLTRAELSAGVNFVQ